MILADAQNHDSWSLEGIKYALSCKSEPQDSGTHLLCNFELVLSLSGPHFLQSVKPGDGGQGVELHQRFSNYRGSAVVG